MAWTDDSADLHDAVQDTFGAPCTWSRPSTGATVTARGILNRTPAKREPDAGAEVYDDVVTLDVIVADLGSFGAPQPDDRVVAEGLTWEVVRVPAADGPSALPVLREVPQ